MIDCSVQAVISTINQNSQTCVEHSAWTRVRGRSWMNKEQLLNQTYKSHKIMFVEQIQEFSSQAEFLVLSVTPHPAALRALLYCL